jgi:hypothetical protein
VGAPLANWFSAPKEINRGAGNKLIHAFVETNGLICMQINVLRTVKAKGKNKTLRALFYLIVSLVYQ